MKKIVLLIGENPYNTTHFFVKALGDALQKKGVIVKILSLQEGCYYETFQNLSQDPPDVTASFSDIHLNGISLGNLLQIPHISLLIDPAYYFVHQMTGDYTCVTAVDEEEVDFFKKLGIQKILFLPHAVPQSLALQTLQQKRDLDIVFFGTAIDIEEIETRWLCDQHGLILKEMAQEVLNGKISCFQAIINKGFSPGGGLFFELYKKLDLYIRGVDRLKLMHALSGFSLSVFGDKIGKRGWRELLQGQKGASVHPAIPFKKAIEVMKKAKIVLNSNLRFKEGSHERIFYGFALGACVITGKNSYIKKAIQGSEWTTYTYGNWADVADKADDLLNHPQLREKIVYEERKNILSHHTWEHRVDRLIEAFNSWFPKSS